MANVEHSSLTGSALHEPKGTATASSGSAYIANGSGSGNISAGNLTTSGVIYLPGSTEGVLTDEDLAAQYRSQADALFKEAKALREQAEELKPTKRKTKKQSDSD